jgi:acylphosphatase
VKIRAVVTVRGRVQGVGFRYHTAQAAERQGVTGWVRNLPDGSVQACFEGEEEDVHAQVEWCRRGPARALVEGLELQEGAFSGEFSGFSVRHGGD